MGKPEPPPPTALGAVDEHGGYSLGTFKSTLGYDIATYTWAPVCGLAEAKGLVCMVHGVFGYSSFEWLSPDADNYRNTLAGSLIESLLNADLAVVAHDHPGHGRSSGLHGYVDSLDEVRDVTIEVAKHFAEMPQLADKRRFLVGMSMGGTTGIQVGRLQPDLFTGFALVSPAVRPPDDMFGWWGQFLRAVNKPLGWLFPKLPVLSLPPSDDPIIRDAVQKDSLVYKGAMRVRLGQEFLRIYDDIDANAETISFKNVVILIGHHDNIVSPAGIEQFFNRIKSDDKKLFNYEKLGHEVLREQGCDCARADLVAWILERAKA